MQERQDRNRFGPVFKDGLVFAAYLLITVFLTWPLITRFQTSIYGAPADNLGEIWTMWWSTSFASLGGTASFCPIIGYPFGTGFAALPIEPVSYLFNRVMLLFANEVVVFNIRTFSSFFISGITMYCLVMYLARDRRVAFVGGLAYLLGPYHAVHAMYMGGGIAAVQWMPLFILLLLRFIDRPSVSRGGMLALGGILVAGTSIHYGLFMAIFTAAFLLGRLVFRFISSRRDRAGAGRTLLLNKNTLQPSPRP